MKIDPVNVIRITGAAGADALRKLEIGAELQAKVVSRQGRTSAVLDIGGGRIRAEFTRGVPAGDSLVLKLDGIRNDSYVFKMIGAGSRADHLARMLEFSLLTPDEVKKFNPADIARILAGRRDALFQMHAYLVQARARGDGKKDDTGLLSRLFSLGISPDARARLAFFLFERAMGSPLADCIYGLLDRDRGKYRGARLQSGVENLAREMESAMDSLESGAEKAALLEYIVGTLGENPSKGPETGLVPLYADDEFVPVRYVRSGNFLALSLDLSALGPLDILARKEKSGIRLMIAPEREYSCRRLENSLSELKNTFGEAGLMVRVSVHNRSIIIDKMVEINSYFSLNSEFDVKV